MNFYQQKYHWTKLKYDWLRLGVVTMVVSACVGRFAMKVEAWITPPLLSPIADIEREYVEVYTQPDSIEDQIKAVFKEYGDQAVKVAKCESGLNPKARNKTSSARGLFQIMQSWHKIDQKWLYNPTVNIEIAHQLFQEQGWEPWRASNGCHHLLNK